MKINLKMEKKEFLQEQGQEITWRLTELKEVMLIR